MSLKALKIVDCVFIFLLCLLVHFMYEWFPNTLFSIFFPVNESIWEHVKMLYSAVIIYGLIDFFLIKLLRFRVRNFLVSLFLSSVGSVLSFLIIYMPLFYIFGNNTFINIFVLIIAIVIGQFISYYILKERIFNNLGYVSLAGIIFMYIIFGILTYYPFESDLFFDFSQNKYGLNDFKV